MRNALSSSRSTEATPTQASTLLPTLFERVDEQARLTVLHIGPALPETVAFFSGYRCRLHFADLFSELPIEVPEDLSGAPDEFLRARIGQTLELPPGSKIDVCLFWDLFNFLDANALTALLAALRPHLHKGTIGHGFSMHSTREPQSRHLYGIESLNQIRLRQRPAALPGFAPHSQSQLQSLLQGWRVERSLLLPDRRLELLLHTKV